jgi:hypothetical protein
MVLNGDQLEAYDLNNGNTVTTLQFVNYQIAQGRPTSWPECGPCRQQRCVFCQRLADRHVGRSDSRCPGYVVSKETTYESLKTRVRVTVNAAAHSGWSQSS